MSTLAPKPETDLSNWQTVPHSRWAFRNVPDLIPTQRIQRDASAPDPMPVRSGSLEGFALKLQNGHSMDLRAFEEVTSTDAIVALVGGEIAYESYRNGMSERTLHILMSTSKAITGLIVGILEELGKIDVEKQVTEYVPEANGTAYAGATIRHLLDMRTAIAFDDAQARLYANTTNWEALSPTESGVDFVDFVKGLPPSGASHGGPFKYVSANTDLLGVAIERAAGKSFADTMSELFWKPLGTEHDALVTLIRGGTARCTGGLCMTARDFARVGRMMLANGRVRSRQMVPETWLDDIFHGGDSKAWSTGEFATSFAPFGTMSYRSGWYIIERTPRTLFAMGIHGQNLFVDPGRDFVLAKFSSQPTPIEQVGLTHLGVAEIRRCLVGK